MGILPTRLVKNFENLSAAIYMLCKKEIRYEEICLACEMLIKFADEFEEIYGPGAVTMNIHVLRHYKQIVESCGPLWSYSMFGFENNIGRLKNFVCGTTDVLNQIAHKYSISRHYNQETALVREKSSDGFYQQLIIKIEQNQHLAAFKNEGVNLSDGLLTIFRRARINNQIFSSTQAKKTKSIDYFVGCQNGSIGKIIFFFRNNSNPMLLLHIYQINHQNFHWLEVNPVDLFEVCSTSQIDEKFLYFQIGSIEYITKEPNTYGRAAW